MTTCPACNGPIDGPPVILGDDVLCSEQCAQTPLSRWKYISVSLRPGVVTEAPIYTRVEMRTVARPLSVELGNGKKFKDARGYKFEPGAEFRFVDEPPQRPYHKGDTGYHPPSVKMKLTPLYIDTVEPEVFAADELIPIPDNDVPWGEERVKPFTEETIEDLPDLIGATVSIVEQLRPFAIPPGTPPFTWLDDLPEGWLWDRIRDALAYRARVDEPRRLGDSRAVAAFHARRVPSHPMFDWTTA